MLCVAMTRYATLCYNILYSEVLNNGNQFSHSKDPKTVQINKIIMITLRTSGIIVIVLNWLISGQQKATVHTN